MNELTNQEIFDKVLFSLREQGFRSFDMATGSCMYRGEHNGRCAAGQLMPDDMYEDTMEGVGIYNIIGKPQDNVWLVQPESPEEGSEARYKQNCIHGALEAGGVPYKSLMLVFHLQLAHDRHMPRRAYSKESRERYMISWEFQMKGIAEHYGLTYTEAE